MSLLSEITKELTSNQQKIAKTIDVTKTEDEIVLDLVTQNIVSFEEKNHDDDQKIQNNQ